MVDGQNKVPLSPPMTFQWMYQAGAMQINPLKAFGDPTQMDTCQLAIRAHTTNELFMILNKADIPIQDILAIYKWSFALFSLYVKLDLT